MNQIHQILMNFIFVPIQLILIYQHYPYDSIVYDFNVVLYDFFNIIFPI
jgi:hypothetical protein